MTFPHADETDLRIDLLGRRVGTHAQDAVLTLEPDLDGRVQMLGNEGGDTDTEVDVEAVADLTCCTLRDTMTPVLGSLV